MGDLFSRFKANAFIQYAHIVCAYSGFGAAVLSILLDFHSWIGLGAQFLSLASAIWISRNKEKPTMTWNVEVFLLYSIFMALYPLIVSELI